MFDSKTNSALIKWTAIGTIFQLIMVISGHYNQFIAENLFAVGGMSISLVFGVAFGAAVTGTRGVAATGGMLVGGTCALIGILVSVVLGDVPSLILAVGTVSSAVSGAIGGFVGTFLGSSRATA